jgi:hypothetical protein
MTMRAVAYHELGHMYIGNQLGVYTDSITINKHGEVTTLESEPDPHTFVVVKLAGYCGQCYAMGIKPTPEGFMTDIPSRKDRESIEEAMGAEDFVGFMANDAAQVMANITAGLELNKDVLEMVAKWLLTRGKVTVAYLAKVCAEA